MNLASNNPRVLGRLLEELSWVGNTIKDYREGGRGFENVLTAEVLQALDFLPRQSFLGSVVEVSQGAMEARKKLREEIEQAEFTLLPGNFYLIPSAKLHRNSLAVQPDGIIQTPSNFVVIEAKRIKRSSFQKEQLAREFVLVMQEALLRNRQPILWLILGSEPPISVLGHGRLNPVDAIEIYLESVLQRTENHDFDKSVLLEKAHEVVCWTTWKAISNVVSEQFSSLSIPDASVKDCVQRLVSSIVQSIEWHS
ncbi:MAG: hypothetical protein DCF19_15015 [Pseudanabaena frigida]|uniref:Restriction endonuclease n=1 Tax=Pseudanabaena frigida TaxID=945775 RepID=A0A2W4Y711_9CYAN|nr:MAG: hypothetical protein DCF19_15015 [Pseudanabaena frigida]